MRNQHSLLLPLHQKRFCQLWIANLLSNLGNWSQTFALTWQVTSLTQSNFKTSLVQTALWAPLFIFAIPAGQLADALPKPRLLFISNLLACVIALTLWALSGSDMISINLMFWLCFLSASASAFTLPAWQTSMSELVSRSQLSAVSSLNNLSFNVAACIAPLFAGIFVLWLGPGPIYLFNALSFCGLLLIYYRWQHQLRTTHPTSISLKRGMRQGVQQVFEQIRTTPSLKILLSLTFLVFCLCNAIPALLPSFRYANTEPSAIHYGMRMGIFGGGSVAAALLVSALRMRFTERQLLRLALSTYGLMLIALAMFKVYVFSMIALFIAGVAWSVIVTSFNSAALRAFSPALRARGLSIYILVNAAGQASGGLIWGRIADMFNLPTSAMLAGVVLLICAVFVHITQEFLEP